MGATADSIYQLIKSYEGQFTPPAPYFTLDVGIFDVDTGTFNGLTTESETDPEPIEHQRGQRPTSPPPRYVGNNLVSVTINADWTTTITVTPAPKVPLAPVLLQFSISHPTQDGWSVTVNGETTQADPGQTSLTANIWDASTANWAVQVGSTVHVDHLLLRRPPGVLSGALGAFTIPVLPVTIVYAPPADSLGKSTATYTQGQTVGQTTTLGTSVDESQTVPVATASPAIMLQFLAAAGKILSGADPAKEGGVAANAAGTLFSIASSEIGKVNPTETSGITGESQDQITVTETTTTALLASAAVGGPGIGDIFYFLRNLRMAWAYFEGPLRLCPLGYENAVYPAKALTQQISAIGLSPGDAEALLALDPFVAGGPSAPPPTDRFEQQETWEYGFGAPFHQTHSVTRDTQSKSTHTTYTTSTDEWEAGPILKSLGFGHKDQTTTKISNAIGSDVSTTITLDANLVSGPADNFVVNLWYDTLFGTLAFQLDQPAATARLRGSGAQPYQEVRLEAGGKVFKTATDQHGAFAFFARAIASGHAVLTIGEGPGQVIEVP